MITSVTQGELADLAAKLPHGGLRDWCDSCGIKDSQTIVYADSGMLSRCLAAANSSLTQESNSESNQESNDENIQRQRGPDLDPIADAGQGPQDAGILGTGPTEPTTLFPNPGELD